MRLLIVGLVLGLSQVASAGTFSGIPIYVYNSDFNQSMIESVEIQKCTSDISARELEVRNLGYSIVDEQTCAVQSDADIGLPNQLHIRAYFQFLK